MSEFAPRPDNLYTEPPLSLEGFAGAYKERLVDKDAARELYDQYSERIRDFPGFGQREFEKAYDDFVGTVLPVKNPLPPEGLLMFRDQLIKPESYDLFKGALASYWGQYNLEHELKEHSIALVSGHNLFTDAPLEAYTLYDIRQADPHAAKRSWMSVGRMIPGMEVDIFNNGGPIPVTPLLQSYVGQIQTVPSVNKKASQMAKDLADSWNEEGKTVLDLVASTPGNDLTMAASGRHDKITNNGQKVTMQRVNPETCRILSNGHLIIVPLFFRCNPFKPGGVEPADITFEILEPRILTRSDEVHDMMHDIADAGSNVARLEFPLGVHYEGPDHRIAA